MANHPFEVFRGFIFQDLSADEKKDDEDIDEDEQDWDDQELDAIGAGALHVQPKKPPYRKVKIRSLENRQTVLVHGNFLSTDPWWEVKVTLKPKTAMGTLRNGRQIFRGMRCQPSYRIRNDAMLDEGGNYGSVLVQFLTECKLEEETKQHFMDYVRKQVPRKEPVNFDTIFGVLEECEVIEDEKIRGLLTMVKPYIMNSECGLLVKQALENPTLFQLLPQLLPDRTITLFKQCVGENSWKLQKLETVLQEKPWALGFSVALRKETNIVLTEVSVDRFQQAGILDTMERHIQDGLHCYYVLKRKCWNEGHTYLWDKGLKTQLKKNYPGYKVQDWKKMWEFLEGVDAVHRKEKGKWMKIFLYRYWKAEDKIVKCLGKILDRGEQDLSCLKEGLDCDDDDGEEKKAKMEEETEKGINEEKTIQDACGSSSQPNTQQHHDSSSCCKKEMDLSCAVKTENDDKDVDLSQLFGNISSDNSATEDEDIPALDDSQPVVPCLDKKALEEKDRVSFADDASQQAAARSMRDNPFTIISGKGGCGKTHVVCKVLEDYPSYAVTMAAPTGKAASNLRKRSHGEIEAFTLHQISWQYTNYMKQKKEYNKQKKIDNEAKEPQFKFNMTEILVVDECSMVPITVFSNVLHALLYQGKLKKLVLLGDYRQLPSVEPGNLLSDLYKVFKQYGWSIELIKNHRSESELIVKNATEISNQRMPIFDAAKGFQLVQLPENDGYDNVQFLHEVVRGLYDSNDSIKDHKRSQFVAFRKADCSLINDWCCPMYAGHPMVDTKQQYVFQTGDKICPTRNANVPDYLEKDDENSSTSFSTSLQQSSSAASKSQSTVNKLEQSSNQAAVDEAADSKQVNNAGQSSDQQKADEAAEIAFLAELCTQHPVSPFPGEEKQMDVSFNKTGEGGEEKEKKANNEKRICNGEIYFIEHVHEIQEPGKKNKDERVTMSDGDKDEKARQNLCAPLRDLKLKAAIRHAWARTIHTYQGSESETVIYLLGNSGAQNWQHVYTAITRGKTQVYIIGTQSQLQKAIRRDARVRNTELKEMLMEEIIPKLKKMQQGGLTQACTQQRGLSQACTQQRGLSQACTQQRGLTQAPSQQRGPTQACAQQHGLSQAYSQGPTQVCTQRLRQRSDRTMTYPTQGVARSQIDNSTLRTNYGGSKMYNASQCKGVSSSQMCKGVSSSQMCNPTFSRPNSVSQTNCVGQSSRNTENRLGAVYNTTSQVGTSSQLGAKSNSGKTGNFFQPLMTSTQVAPSNRQGQWRGKSLFGSPKKSFTSIKDLPRTSLTKERPNTRSKVNGIVHSTPKSSKPADGLQRGQGEDFDDWANEWSPEKLQQVIDMENTYLESRRDVTTPPLYDEDKLTPEESDFKSPPPTRKLMPEVVSPFSPNTSARLSQSWAVKSPPKNAVAKRLYTEMKESPITDGLPYKKRNDFNESDLF